MADIPAPLRSGRCAPTLELTQLALEHAPAPMWLARSARECLAVNRSWREFSGLAIEAATGAGWLQTIHPDDLATLISTWGFCQMAGKTLNAELRLRHADGHFVWCALRAQPIVANDTIVAWSGINTPLATHNPLHWPLLRDVDPHVVEPAPEYIPVSAPMMRAIDCIPGLVWSSLADGYVDFLNQPWLDYTGLSHQQASGWGWQQAIHPDDLKDLVRTWNAVLEAAQPGQTEARLRRKDGAYRWFLFRATPLFDAQGTLVKWYGQTTDIDDLKVAEAHLAGEKHLLEMTAKGEAIERILNDLCEFVESVQTGCWCSVMLLDHTQSRLSYGRAPKLPCLYLQHTAHIRLAGGLMGPCPLAVQLKQQVIAADLGVDPVWRESPWASLALSQGIRACWSTPIIGSNGVVLGTIALLFDQPRKPSADELARVDQYVHLAAIALERASSEHALKRSELYLAEAQKLSHTGSFGWQATTGQLSWSEQTHRILEYPASVQADLEKVLQRVVPRQRRQLETVFRDTALHFESMNERLELSFADGRRKIVRVVADHQGNGEYIGAIMDITAAETTARNIRISEQLARSQAAVLTGTLDSLAKESAPDKLVEHALRAIIKELTAHSCSLWRKHEDSDLLTWRCALENDQLVTDNIGKARASYRIGEVWPWPEIFRTRLPYVLQDIRESAFPWREQVMAQGIITIVIVPMLILGEVEGVIGIRFVQKRELHSEELALAQALTHQAMLATRLTELYAKSRQALIDGERNRLARDIHDVLAQGLTGSIVQMEAASDAALRGLADEAELHLIRARDLARMSLQEARRSVRALRPALLKDKALPEALAELLATMTSGTSLTSDFSTRGNTRILPPAWEDNLLRVAQEALSNSLRHAQAQQFRGRLLFRANTVELVFSDDGKGFDLNDHHEGFGLLGISERIEAMGGQLTITSRHRKGTRLRIVLPSPASDALS